MGKKCRILFDNLFVARGGAEVFMTNLINYLPRDRYDITVAAIYWNKNDPNEKLPPGVRFITRYHRRKKYKKLTPAWFLDVSYGRIYDALVSLYLSLLNFDIAIAVQEKRTMLRTAGIRAKRKFAWIHTDYTSRLDKDRENLFGSPEKERACMAKFEKVVCVSQTTMDSVIKTIGDPGNLCVRYNPIDARRIQELSLQPCPLRHSGEKPLLVSVGRLVAEKQYTLLLEACRMLKDSLDFDVWIIGDGEERPMLEEYIAKENLSFVKLLGTQSNPFPYLRQADLFVTTSRTEGYGLAVQEALILGVPVVAVNCPAFAECLEPKFAFLVNNSPNALEAVIEKMLTDSKIYNLYKENIARDFKTDDLYHKRLEDICALWET